MGRVKIGMLGLLVAGLVAAPQPASAQSSDGWWEWALVQKADEEPRTLSDILRERIEDARRERDRTDRDRTDRDGRIDRDGRSDTRRDRDDDDDRWERDDDDDRWERDDDDRYERADRRGPPFCRNGQGHPVHGRQWCRDKGFGMGSRDRDIRWEDRGWEGVILDGPRTERRSTVDRGGLIDILGDVVLGRVDRERRRLGGTTPLQGRWVDLGRQGRVLQIRSGSVPVAELSDLDGDGRVDIALVPRR